MSLRLVDNAPFSTPHIMEVSGDCRISTTKLQIHYQVITDGRRERRES
jgi:hypothetical protein